MMRVFNVIIKQNQAKLKTGLKKVRVEVWPFCCCVTTSTFSAACAAALLLFSLLQETDFMTFINVACSCCNVTLSSRPTMLSAAALFPHILYCDVFQDKKDVSVHPHSIYLKIFSHFFHQGVNFKISSMYETLHCTTLQSGSCIASESLDSPLSFKLQVSTWV